MATEKTTKDDAIKFGDTKKADTVRLVAKKNIALSTIVRRDPSLMQDEKVKLGGRVERGTAIVVPKVVGERLVADGYAA